MPEFFKDIPRIKYEGKTSKNPLAFKFYNPDEVIGGSWNHSGKTMREILKFALSWWHTICADGSDMFGRGTSFKNTDTENKIYTAFEIMDKLSIDYYCFHDRDIVPDCADLSETNEKFDKAVELLHKMQNDCGKKLLWGTANCFSHPRYMHGAGTNPHPDVFAFAAAQIKKAIEATVKLGGAGYTFWGGREGYETLLNTDMGFELDNMARLMKLSVEYARSIGYKGVFYVEPKPKEPTKHQYDFDSATVIGFLHRYGLDKDFKLNIEANHATLAMHTFQHELRVARENGFFGSIDANQGDILLGWDTDQFPTNVYDTSLCMYEVIKAGGFKEGGLNFDSKTRRGSFNPDDIFLSYIAGMDAFALGLRIAGKMIADGRIDGFVKERYCGWNDGIGKEILSGNMSLADLEKYALDKGEVLQSVTSGRQEYLETVMNEIMFTF
jgi:xylose isomerase